MPSRALSPIQDDDIELQPAELDVQHRDDQGPDRLSSEYPPPTGRKRETTDTSIISFSNVALFPVPPPRNASFDNVSSVLLNSPSCEEVSVCEIEGVDVKEMEETDAEAIVDLPSLGRSPELGDMIALMRSRQPEECDADSEIGERTS